ncbi:MAG: tyrosine-protein phosphatase [Dehalococcoidia bacterium]
MTLDPTVPSDFITPLPEEYEPRATRLVLASMPHVRTQIWMGGVHTMLGDALEEHHLTSAWVVDCAGELPPTMAASARRHLPRVFLDIEAVPSNMDRITAVVREMADSLRGEDAPERVYVMCKQGLNRSGLVTAMLLRALGVPSAEVVGLVRAARPGALNNVTFVGLAEQPDADAGAAAAAGAG